MSYSVLCLNISSFGYICALLFYISNLVKYKNYIRKAATIIMAISFICQTLGLLFRWMEAGLIEVKAYEVATGAALLGLKWFSVFTQHPPWSNLYEILAYMSWGLVLVCLVVESKIHTKLIPIFCLLLTLIILGIVSLTTDADIRPLVPALQSKWILIHVLSSTIAYACGSLAAITSLFYLLKSEKQIKLTTIAAWIMAFSSFIIFILGKGFNLFISFDYKVKLLGTLHNKTVVVSQFLQGQDAKSYFVPIPYAGALMAVTITLCIFSAIILYHYSNNEALVKIAALLPTMITLITIAFIGFNLINTNNIIVRPDIAQQLSPPGKWFLSIKSNQWDMALLIIILGLQFLITISLIYPKFIRSILPEAKLLDLISYKAIIVSFTFMAIVLITGALWAHYAWGRYWGWDPKETGALLIWLTYALYLHMRVTKGYVGVKPALIGVFAFFVIIAGFLGVNLGFFANGLHSYGSN